MDILVVGTKIGVYGLMGLCVAAALATVTLRNIFHAALALAVTLIGVAGIYFALQAEFLAVVQILIYVGAVMTLVVFTIMLTHGLENKTLKQQNPLSLAAALGGLSFILLLTKLILDTPWAVKEKTMESKVTTFDLGQALLGPYVYPFEFISVILIAVLVGAIIIARKEKT